MERTTKFFLLATRMLAEFGCQIIKTYYCEDMKVWILDPEKDEFKFVSKI